MKTAASASSLNTTARMVAKASDRIAKSKFLAPYTEALNSTRMSYSRTPTNQSFYKDNLLDVPKELCGNKLKEVNELPDLHKFYKALPYYNTKVAKVLTHLRRACKRVTSDALIVFHIENC
eukprot:TRINITY_DN10129_c0_g2_i2.p1 TRINITY_DN10129_c0_g2~~TRINITY_DN10129_c0_g2_i2.p1  ORF type:complete len:121 (-),score=7.41 TRINITY_DN10129_c0_g2_i2:737-1099(-)